MCIFFLGGHFAKSGIATAAILERAMLITVFDPIITHSPGLGINITRKCSDEALFLFMKNMKSIQQKAKELIIRCGVDVYQLVYCDEGQAAEAYRVLIQYFGA